MKTESRYKNKLTTESCFHLHKILDSVVSVFMTDRLFGKIYPPSRRKAVMQHYAGRKFSPFRRNLFFFPLYLLLIPAMVLLGTALKWITEILK